MFRIVANLKFNAGSQVQILDVIRGDALKVAFDTLNTSACKVGAVPHISVYTFR
jgi:hypothetical protein